MQLGQGPPDALHIGGVHRPVGLAGVDPEADPLGQLLEGVDVALDRLAAAGVERLHPVALDRLLVLEPQLLLDLQLDRQAVAVPAALAVDPVAAHGLEAGEQVLEDPGLHVVHARAGRWPSAAPRRRRTARPRPAGRASAGTPCGRATAPGSGRPARGGRGWGRPRGTGPSGDRLLRVVGQSQRRDEAGAPRYHPSCRPPHGHRPLTGLPGTPGWPPAVTGWPGCAYWALGRRSGSGSGRMFGRRRAAGLPPSPARWRPCRPLLVPVVACMVKSTPGRQSH